MSEHPIIFSTDMVRAVLDGQKTQTRRIVKVPKIHPDYGFPHWDDAWSDGDKNEQYLHIPFSGDAMGRTAHRAFCRYQVGDTLWVRETWQAGIEWDDEKPRDIDPLCGGNDINFLTDGKKIADEGWGKIRPSIFMPRWAARIFLEITNIRVERVQDIDNNWEDCLREGIDAPDICEAHGVHYKALLMFKKLWNSLNAKRGFSWDSNPFVWVISFKRAERK